MFVCFSGLHLFLLNAPPTTLKSVVCYDFNFKVITILQLHIFLSTWELQYVRVLLKNKRTANVLNLTRFIYLDGFHWHEIPKEQRLHVSETKRNAIANQNQRY